MDPLPTDPHDLAARKPPNDRAGFLYRLGIYCVGIAIGFMILGMFRARSAVEAKRRQAEQAALEAQYPPYPGPTSGAPAGTAPAPVAVPPPKPSPAPASQTAPDR